MTQLRSYTEIEQSQKLAEFLPIESADMFYPNRADVKYQGVLPIEFKLGNPLLSQEIPCWSLAALLNVLPVNIEYKGELLRIRLDLGEKDFNIWYDNTDTGNASDIDILADNPLNACYDMILLLHDKKLI